MQWGAGAEANKRSGCARRPAAMHAQHHNDGLVERFDVEVWVTDAQEQARNSVGEDKAPLAWRGGRLSARPNRFGLSTLPRVPQWLKSLF
jgi:hypothetical protein